MPGCPGLSCCYHRHMEGQTFPPDRCMASGYQRNGSTCLYDHLLIYRPLIYMSPYTPRQITSVFILGALTLTLISEVIHVVTFDPQNSETYRLGWAFPQRNGYMAWFSMSISSPVPRAYAVLLFGVCTVLMGRLAYESTRVHQKMGLWFAGLLCLFYAVDKITALHSVLPVSYRQMLLSNWMLWCIPIIPIMYGFFRVLPYQIRYWFILGCLLLASSFAIDRWSVYITGRYSGHHMIGALMGDAEGLMEMMGAVLVIHGMLVYWAGRQVGRWAKRQST